MLAMETMDTPFLNSITRNAYYEKELNSPWYAVYPDIGNLTAWGHDIARELKNGFGSIVAVHLKDTIPVTRDASGTFKSVPFGGGAVDFVSAFRILHDLKYTGPYLVEMWSRNQSLHESITSVKAAQDFLQQEYRKAVPSSAGEHSA